MKTKKQVLEENPDYKVLINAVISRIGMDSVMDVVNHGADSGFSGFIYYVDTHKFAMRYRKLIIKLLDDMADQLGEDVVKMVEGFGVFSRSPMDKDDHKELYRYLGEAKCEQSQITNVMAWYALEECSRMFQEDYS